MRIALLSFDMRRHPQDGATKTIYQILDRLEAEKIPFLVLSTTFDSDWPYHYGTRAQLPSIPMVMHRPYRFSTASRRQVFGLLDHFRPTVIHLSSYCKTAHLMSEYAKFHHIGLVGIYHTRISSYLRSLRLGWTTPFTDFLHRRFYNRFDLLLTPTWTIFRELKEIGIRAPMKVWGRGVENNLFNPGQRSEAWRTRLGVSPQQPIVLYAGRLAREKNLNAFVDAHHSVKKMYPDAMWVIAGTGMWEKKMRSSCPGTLFLGQIPHAEMGTIFASSDIFAYPSESETFGNVILEAMASGLPVIGADGGGSQELIRGAYGEEALLFNPSNGKSFGEQIAFLLSNGSLRQTLAKRSLAFASRWRWEYLTSELMGDYKSTAYGVSVAESSLQKNLIDPPLAPSERNSLGMDSLVNI